MKRIVWIPALALLVGCAGISARDVIEPDVQLVNIVPIGATLFEQELRVDLRIINPNDFDLPIGGLTFDLRVNGDRVARGNSPDGVKVPRLGDAVIQVTTRTSSIAMVRQLMNPPKSGVYEYEISGDVLVSGFTRTRLPFEHKGEMPSLTPPPGSPTP
jgi:LEA14-like dessication related protein